MRSNESGKTREGDLDAMMARPAEFGNELESARDRAEAVRQVVGESQLQRSSFVLEAVEKVETTLEELPVSQDRSVNMEIEERVRQRTAELQQLIELKDELLIREQRARSDAEAANRSKDEFLAFVAHELRTPLNAIVGWARVMRFEMGDEAQRARAGEVIERSALAQSRIINDILDDSRIVTGNLQLDMRSLDFAVVVRAAVEAARPAIDAKGIHLDTMLDESIGAVTGDSTRLQEVVDNILSNSIKFTPAGGRISISLNRAWDMAQLIVRDTGDGISPAFLPYVFERFRQADGVMTKRQGGLGLGLAIVNHLVKMHGGTVEATSEGEGKGSTFTMNLPFR